MNMHIPSSDRFRPIQYLGNKTRLLDEIAEAMAQVVAPGRTVADLFSGTAVVGRRLAQRNPVVAVDVQAFAETLGRAMLVACAGDFDGFDEAAFYARAEAAAAALADTFAPLMRHEDDALAALRAGNALAVTALIEEGSPLSRAARAATRGLPAKVKALLGTGSIDLPDATAALAFGGVYFSFEQCIWLDAFHHAAAAEPGPRRDVLVAAMLGAASEVVNTVGKQFAQPIRLLDGQGEAKPLLMQRTLRDRGLDVRAQFAKLLARWRAALADDGCANRMVRGDVDVFLGAEGDWDAVYADPPYTIDHYSRFYHVLETLVRRDRPALSRMGAAPRVAVTVA